MEYSRIDKKDGHVVLVYDLDECLQAIRARNEDNEENIERLKEEIHTLKSEHYKDEQLQKFKKKLDKMRNDYLRGFPISEQEDKLIKNWQQKHNTEVHDIKTDEERMKANGCIGGQFSYEFTITSIGVLGYVKCNICGEKYCFSDIF